MTRSVFDPLASAALSAAELGWIPDPLIRIGIRRLCAQRLSEIDAHDATRAERRREAFLAWMQENPVAIETVAANEQHYEVPPEFFENCLGKRAKYSCCFYGDDFSIGDLDEAEEAMLALTCERAGLEDGMTVLDFGCGWGSLSLWIAEKYPSCRVLGVSNSRPQREHILDRATKRGLGNLEIRTADANVFRPEPGDAPFDRILSIEMFEHMRNWKVLFGRMADWLAPEGRVFLHYFAHREVPYPFEDEGEDDWMARHFFTGGIMPCFDLATRFPDELVVEESWYVDGRHYQRTSEDWLALMDARRESVLPIFSATYGAGEAKRWFGRWRLFYMAVAELFGFDRGREWVVAHHRLKRPTA